MQRSLREQLFSCFPDTATRAACLPSRLGARSTRRRRVKNQNQVNSSAGTVAGPAGTDVSVPLRWSTADERALEEAVVRARMELLFDGIKT